jgi:hypothetical protein
MASIKRALFPAVFLLPALFLLALTPAFSQAAPVSLAAEIQGIEKKLSGSGLSPGERKQALMNLGRLFELSGDMEGAARAWTDAALSGDTASFLRSASCFAAMGEFGRAEDALRTARKAAQGTFGAAENPALAGRVRYLEGQIEGLKSGRTDILQSLLREDAYAELRPGIYYSLWKITGESRYRSGLLSEYPASPEALILLGANDAAPAVGAVPSALWLLMGEEPPAFAAGFRGDAGENPPAPAVPSVQAAAGAPALLQTGLFSLEENANVLAGRLNTAGFTPVVSTKTVNGVSYWVVGVRPGQDYNRTILLLKNAGFEAFPVF